MAIGAQIELGGLMAVREKGGMWCPACARPVAARKTGRRVRNTASGVAAPLTGGLSLLFARVDRWHCGHCGGPVTRPPRLLAGAALAPTGEEAVTLALLDPGPKKIPTMKALRAVTHADVRTAERWYLDAPVEIEGLSVTAAEDLIARLAAVGARAEVRRDG